MESFWESLKKVWDFIVRMLLSFFTYMVALLKSEPKYSFGALQGTIEGSSTDGKPIEILTPSISINKTKGCPSKGDKKTARDGQLWIPKTGEYFIYFFKEGQHSVEFGADGFEPQEETVGVTKDGTAPQILNIRLKASANSKIDKPPGEVL